MAGLEARSETCFIHFSGEVGPLTSLTDTSFHKISTSHELWLTLDGQQREVAERITKKMEEIKSQEDPALGNLYYHRTCYSKFTNITFIKRAQDRCAKNDETVCHQGERSEEEGTARKVLRSSMSCGVQSRSRHVLPPICIICGEEKSYVNDTVRTPYVLYILCT